MERHLQQTRLMGGFCCASCGNSASTCRGRTGRRARPRTSPPMAGPRDTERAV